MIKAMLDTNICIYLIKNNPPEVGERFRKYVFGELGISSIAVSELMYGVHKSRQPEKNMTALDAFLLPLKILPFDEAASRQYGLLRAALEKKGTPIGSMDMLIAAHALAMGCTLITHNIREFNRVEGLKTETWIN